MSFEINPCQSVAKRVLTANYDINTVNDDCYGICASYGNVYGHQVQKKCEAKCRDMLSRQKQNMGKSDCDLRRPPPPPIWNQVPDFYARLLADCGNKQKAYKQCWNMCNSSRYPKSCKRKCQLDANAVVTTEPYKNRNKKTNYDMKAISEPYKDENKKTKSIPAAFFLGVFLVVVILVYFLWRSLYKD